MIVWREVRLTYKKSHTWKSTAYQNPAFKLDVFSNVTEQFLPLYTGHERTLVRITTKHTSLFHYGDTTTVIYNLYVNDISHMIISSRKDTDSR